MSADDFWNQVVGKKEKKELSPLTSIPPKEAKVVDDPFLTEGIAGAIAELPKETGTTPAPTETKEISAPASPPLDDPFAEKAGTVVEGPIVNSTQQEVISIQQPPVLSPPCEPFSQATSQDEEFLKQKPASSGKNLSFMIHGDKGTSKTATALSLPGKIFAISLDQQTAIIHEDFFKKDSRIEVWDGIEFFNSKDPTTKLETASKTVDYINWLLENPCKKFQPDWILFDGTERLTHVCEMAMRAQENLLPYEGVKNRNAWKYRNDLVNNFVQRAAQIARLGVIYTAYSEVKTITTAMGEESREGPKWFGDIEQKTQIVLKTTSSRTQNRRVFVVEVESSKVSYIPTGRRVVIGERMDSGEIQNYIGIKAIFTPEGNKKYFSSGGD